MRLTYALLAIFLLAVALVGCGQRRLDPSGIQNTSVSGQLSAREAALHEFRYAFSGQVWNESSRLMITQFSIDLLLADPAVNTVVNPLGSSNGAFHISRSPGSGDSPVSTVPVVVLAPGYEPEARFIEIAADCESLRCPGRRPLPFFLKPVSGLQAARGAILDPRKTSELIAARPTMQIFDELIKAGKIDAPSESRLRVARSGQVMTQTLVVLDPIRPTHLESTLMYLFSAARPERLRGLAGPFTGTIASVAPKLASQNPELAAALVSAHALLPYLLPFQERFTDLTTAPLAQVTAALLRDRDLNSNVLTLVSALQGQTRSPQGQMAMAAVVPLIQGLLTKKERSQSPFVPLLQRVLLDPSLSNLLAQGNRWERSSDSRLELLLKYGAPVLQGFTGKKAPELMALFNELVKSEGLKGLQRLKATDPRYERYAPLFPYLEAVVKGLNGNEARPLAEALTPVLSQRNPAQRLADLLLRWNSTHPDSAQVASRVFPALNHVLQEAISAKQLFAAQLLTGLVNGDFKDVRIETDVKGSSALMLSIQARDLLKIAQLANVRKIISLEKKSPSE